MIAYEADELLAREVERHGGMHRDDVCIRLAPEHQRDLADGLADAERRDHERLAGVFVTDDGHLARRDEVEAARVLAFDDELVAFLEDARFEPLDERGPLLGGD